LSTVYHIDSCILTALLDRYDEMHRFYDSLFRRYNSHYLFLISHVAFGETIHILMEKEMDLDLDHIHSRMEYYNIKVTNMPNSNILIDIIRKIREYDDRLNYNDMLIVAAAIADPDSKGLITTDSDMIGNIAISEVASSMGKPNFIVSDNPFSRKRRRR